jgi:hypothetical protein
MLLLANSSRKRHMQLFSQAKIPVAKVIWRPGHGGFAFTVVCKATFELRPDLSPFAHTQEPVTEADEWTDTGSLGRSTDLLPFKKRPEVLVVGDAFAPEGRPVNSLVTRLVVGEINKSIVVVGDRYASADGRVGESAPFARMPLVWERAAGGQNTDNPVGRPFGLAARNVSPEWTLAPNLYPPGFEVPRPGISVAPVAYAPISPLWPSRLGCLNQHAVGWDPLRWHERPLPNDIDFAYMNAAPVDQQRTAPFADEVLYLENLHPVFARLSTRLPVVTPLAMVDQGTGPEPLKLRCDTLVIDTNRGLAMLVWRGHVVMDRPDRPGHVVVTGPDMPELTTPPPVISDEIDETAIIVPARHRPAAVALPFAKPTTAPFPNASSAHSPAPPLGNVVQEPVDHPNPNDDGETIVPGHFTRSDPAVVLPFAKATTPPVFAAPPPTNLAREPVDHSNDDGDTIVPTASALLARVAPVLPFAGTPIEPAQPHVESPVYQPSIGQASAYQAPVYQAPVYQAPIAQPSIAQPPIDARGPAILGAWGQLAPDKPKASASVVPSTPAQEPIEETKSAGEPDAMENRLRTIQRAIWKGDRPIQQILAEHGMTELEWRAAKRATARKSNA